MITVSKEIDAPIERVWSVLMDFPSYVEWNPFIRSITYVDDSKQEQADQSQTLAAGSHLLFRVNLPPTMENVKPHSEAFVLVVSVDRAQYRVCWKSIDFPTWIMRGERWQVLTALGDNKTVYTSQEVFVGPMSYVIKWMLGDKVKLGFEAAASGLKARCEQSTA